MWINRKIRELKEYIYDSSISLKDRSFVIFSVILIAELLFGAIPSGLIMHEPLSSTLSTFLGALLFTIYVLYAFKTKHLNRAKIVISILLIFVFLPLMFFTNGGVCSGVPVSLLLGGMYINMILEGKFQMVMNVLYAFTMIVCWCVGYYYPNLVTEYTREGTFIDSLLGLLIVHTVIFVLLLFHTKLYKKENEIASEKSAQLEEMNRSQNRFFSSMSHEIRTPINTVLGLNEIILRQEDASEEIRKDARNIQGAGKMLLALVNDILDISKIEAGKMDIVPVNYNVSSLLAEVVNMVWLKAEEKGLRFEVDVDPYVPETLFGDEVRIKQILINLLNNAVKYTKEGFVGLYIECESEEEKHVILKIRVADSGMGIKPESLPHLFDTFQRLDEEKNRFIEGTGLGLSIVKQLVELMGGSITVNSVYGQGSTFSVTLKQQVSSEKRIGNVDIANVRALAAGDHFEHRFHAPHAKVLIVDDNEMNLQVEKKLLDGIGMQVDLAMSGAEALTLSLRVRYDVIFMDHLMPEMDGIECYEKIQKQNGGLNQNTPVVVLTANAGTENLELYNHAGFDGYLLKPVSGLQMEDALLEHLPKGKIIDAGSTEMTGTQMNTAKGYEKKRPMIICASSMTDIPREMIGELEIAILPFRVITNEGSFMDNIDVDSDELVRYMGDENRYVSSDPPTEEEYVQFFANQLKKAHHLVYISLASKTSEEFERATQAAGTFENVTVVDSELLSSSAGILAMIAGRMAKQNVPVEKLVAELEEAKKRIHCNFVIASTDVMARRNRISPFANALLTTLWLRPVLGMKNKNLAVNRFLFGNQKRAYEKYIKYALPSKGHPDKDFAFITCVGMEESDIRWIKEEILKRVPFEHLLLKKASAGIATNCGAGTFGILYMDKTNTNYNLAALFEREQRLGEEDMEEEEEAVKEALVQKPTKEWYQMILGLDAQVGIKNSGSLDSFLSVLKIYYDSFDMKYKELQDYYEACDWKNYTIKIHALKSSSRLVGVLDFGNAAEELEMAGKKGDVSFIETHHGPAMEKYKGIINGLSVKFGQKKDLPQIPADTLAEAYAAIEEFSASMDYDCVNMVLESMKEYTLMSQDKEKFDKIRVLLSKMDWDGINKTIKG